MEGWHSITLLPQNIFPHANHGYVLTFPILAWRIPGTREPGELPSMGSHRVGHNWSDLTAAAAYSSKDVSQYHLLFFFFLAMPLTCGISVPWPGIEPMPPKAGIWSHPGKFFNIILLNISLLTTEVEHTVLFYRTCVFEEVFISVRCIFISLSSLFSYWCKRNLCSYKCWKYFISFCHLSFYLWCLLAKETSEKAIAPYSGTLA